MAREHKISITDNRTGKTTIHALPAPKPGEKANTQDLTVGDVFECRGVLYKVTGRDGEMCYAKKFNGDVRAFAFICEVVDYKGHFKDPVVVTCYRKTKVWERKKAMDFFFEGMASCEGAEQERYVTIYCQLTRGATVVSDEY